MKKAALALAVLVCVLLAIMVVRATRLTRPTMREAPVSIALDETAAAERLAGALRFQTISHQEADKVDAAAFRGLHGYLETAFPAAHRGLKKETVGGLSLLYRWEGRNPALKPIILMSHLDVVPVDPGTEAQWTHPPFAGVIADGCIWGRGTIDFKFAATALLEATEHLMASGFTPERDIYFAFGHDEETSGTAGARSIAALLQSRGIQAAFILDEGLCITERMIPGVDKPVALIGVAEKGYLTLQLTATSPGGHASMPPRRTAVSALAQALVKLEEHPFPVVLTSQARHMFEALAPEMPWAKRVILGNLWLTRGIVTGMLSRSDAASALLHTTMAATMLSASPKENVLAERASAVVNLRLLPGDTIASATAHVQKVLKADSIAVEALGGGWDPSPISPMDAPAYRTLQKTVAQLFPDTAVAPGQVPGGSDSRHYTGVSPCIYRFMPIRVNPDLLKGVHSTNERIPVKDYANAVRYYIQLMRNAQAI